MRAAWALTMTLLLTGCSDAPPESLDAVATQTPDAADAPVFEQRTVLATEQTAWEGRTKEGFFVCSDQDGTGSCPAGQQVQPDGQHTTNVSYAGNLTRLSVLLDWTPADATQTGLVLVAYGGSLLGTVRGPPGLNLTVEAPAAPPDGTLTLIVWPEGKTPTNPSLFVDVTRQDFVATVTVTTATTETVEVVP